MQIFQAQAVEPGAARATFLSATYFPSLNGLRFFSALAIIKEHTHLQLAQPRMLQFGWLGVDLFFVLSGFLIVTLLIRERQRTGEISLHKFYARRAFRIFPIYYLLVLSVLLLYAVVSPWDSNGLRFYEWTFPVLLTYTQDLLIVPIGIFFHTWSLAMEEQFYLVWPFIEKLFKGQAKWYLFAVALLVNQLINFGVGRNLIAHAYGTQAATKLPIFLATFTPILLGVLIAHLLNDERGFRVIYRLVGHAFAPLAVVLAMALAFQFMPNDIQGWPRLMVHLLMALLICSIVVAPDNVLRPLLDHPLIARLGAISYGIYLYHVVIYTLLLGAFHKSGVHAPSPLLLFVVTTGLTLLIAEGSYRYVEQPFLRLKSRFSPATPRPADRTAPIGSPAPRLGSERS